MGTHLLDKKSDKTLQTVKISSFKKKNKDAPNLFVLLLLLLKTL
jgi:hypothetical protein